MQPDGDFRTSRLVERSLAAGCHPGSVRSGQIAGKIPSILCVHRFGAGRFGISLRHINCKAITECTALLEHAVRDAVVRMRSYLRNIEERVCRSCEPGPCRAMDYGDNVWIVFFLGRDSCVFSAALEFGQGYGRSGT